VLKEDRIDESLAMGVQWLAAALCPCGRFNWSGSGLSFAYHLSGRMRSRTPPSSMHPGNNGRYREHAGLCLNRLEETVRGGLCAQVGNRVPGAACPRRSLQQRRWHRSGSTRYGTGRSGSATQSTGQIARRRYSETAETRSFKALCRLLRIRSSTVEPSKNFPDLFMTSEVLDCLSQSGIWGNSHETGIT